MALDVQTCVDEIIEQSEQLATEVAGHLEAPIEHCPGWTVAELLEHLIKVQWFWATVVEQRLETPPEGAGPGPIERGDLVARFRDGAYHLAAVLGAAEQDQPVWTWAPLQHDVAFVTRHQVQEIVVHHWDAAHALGRTMIVGADVACDAIEEFLTFSVSSDVDPADPPRPALDGALGLRCTDVDKGWTVRDAATPGTVTFERGVAAGVASLSATSSDLLLWLYSRVEIPSTPEASELGERLRALCFTT